jgi:anti-sigma B factor antagonist
MRNRPPLSRKDGYEPPALPRTTLVPLVEEFSLGSSGSGDAVVVTVRGDLDLANAPTLQGALSGLIEDQGARRLVVDLEGLTFIDSAGIYALVQALKHVRRRGGDLALKNVTPGAHKVLDVCCLTGAFGTVNVPTTSRAASGRRRAVQSAKP